MEEQAFINIVTWKQSNICERNTPRSNNRAYLAQADRLGNGNNKQHIASSFIIGYNKELDLFGVQKTQERYVIPKQRQRHRNW